MALPKGSQEQRREKRRGISRTYNIDINWLTGFNKDKDLQEVAELSGVLDAPLDFISSELCLKFETLVPNAVSIWPSDFVQVPLSIKYSDMQFDTST